MPDKEDIKREQLRIGILVNDFCIPYWSYKMLEEILEGNYAEIVLIIKKKNEVGNRSFKQKITLNRKEFLYNTYRSLDRKLFQCSPDAFQRKNIKELLNTPVIEVDPKRTKYCDSIKEDDIERIKDYTPDILIRLGFRILKGEILRTPRFGIWSFHHGDNSVNRGGPAGFWEVMNREKETGVVLQILSDKLDGGAVLYKSFSLTDRISVHRNINRYYWKALSFIPRKLKELHDVGEEKFFQRTKSENTDLKFYNHSLYRPPSNGQMTILILKLFFREFNRKIKGLFFFEQWGLLYKINSNQEISTALYQFKKIVPPKDRIWADPQVIFKNEKYYIFIEEMLLKENKGWISVIEMDKKGKFKNPIKVLENETHLSYPFIFEENNEIYMIPESKKSGRLDLYKSKNFPFDWKLEKILMKDVRAVDPTILKYRNKYWLFMNMVKNKGASSHDELYLFFSDNLISDQWSSHPQNPVLSDVKSARPAGRPILYGGTLYRPSQNCSNYYGYGLNFNRIDILNEERYQETIVDEILPHWDKDIVGIHTFNSTGELTITDALFKRNRFR